MNIFGILILILFVIINFFCGVKYRKRYNPIFQSIIGMIGGFLIGRFLL